MHCPKCKTEYLKPTKLEEGLPVMGCPKCEGSFISLLYYRDWAERVKIESSDQVNEVELESDSDTKTALCCPKCSRLMTKYVVSGALDNRIDLCGNCDEAWLDGGEWRLLKALELGNKLPREPLNNLVIGLQNTNWHQSQENKPSISSFLAI